MRYYYYVNISNIPSIDEVPNYIQDRLDVLGLNCFEPKSLKGLSDIFSVPFSTILKYMFVAVLSAEHRVTKLIAKDYFSTYLTEKDLTLFEREYYKKIKPYYNNAPKPILDKNGNLPKINSRCEKVQKELGVYGILDSLKILHKEDEVFLFNQRDEFLSHLEEVEKVKKEGSDLSPDIIKLCGPSYFAERALVKLLDNKTYTTQYYEAEKGAIISNKHHIIILLDDEYGYLGHIYTWSPLIFNINSHSCDIDTLKFGGIRSSLLNTLSKKERGIAKTFIGIIADIAKKQGWEFIEVALTPVGPMQELLNSLNFEMNIHSIPRFIETTKLFCRNDAKQIDVNCSLYRDSFVFPNNFILASIPELNKAGISDCYATKLYRVLKKTYPDMMINNDTILNLRNAILAYNMYGMNL